MTQHDEYPIDRMVRKIRAMKKSATDLKELSGGIEAVSRNADRILASVKMLDINVSDVAASRPPRRNGRARRGSGSA